MTIAQRFFASAALAFGIVVSAVAGAGETEQADLILTHGHVYTPQGWAEALAIRDGVIVAVGRDSTVAALRGKTTMLIDLAGKTVLPGLQDMHAHWLIGGPLHQGCYVKPDSAPDRILDKIRACVAKTAKGGWVFAGLFDPGQFPDRSGMRTLLDSVSPDNPVAILAFDGRTLWGNSLALKAAGITATTPSPPGGVIYKDKDGNPTGLLDDAAAVPLKKAIPRPTEAQKIAALEEASRLFASFGITAVTEARVEHNDQALIAALADKGALRQRMRVCNEWAPAQGGQPEIGLAAIRDRNLYARPMVDTSCVKIFIDGAATLGRTAAMLEPYLPHDGVTDDKGALRMSPQTLADALTSFDAQGLTVKVHAGGDAAIRAALDAFEAMRKRNGFTRLHEIAHWTFAKPEDIARARGLGITVEFSCYIWNPAEPLYKSMAAAVGPDRMAHFAPARTALGSGANVTLGSDWPAIDSPSPWPAIESLVTRRAPGDTKGPVVAPDERITLKDAIAMMTLNGAKQLGMADRIGRIAPGMLADLAVLDRNPFEIPITELGKTKAVLTLVNGKIVYDAARAD